MNASAAAQLAWDIGGSVMVVLVPLVVFLVGMAVLGEVRR